MTKKEILRRILAAEKQQKLIFEKIAKLTKLLDEKEYDEKVRKFVKLLGPQEGYTEEEMVKTVKKVLIKAPGVLTELYHPRNLIRISRK